MVDGSSQRSNIERAELRDLLLEDYSHQRRKAWFAPPTEAADHTFRVRTRTLITRSQNGGGFVNDCRVSGMRLQELVVFNASQ